MTDILNRTAADSELKEDAPIEDPALARIASHVRAILGELGLDLADPNLRETDRRVARMYAEMFSGLREGSRPQVTCFPNDRILGLSKFARILEFYAKRPQLQERLTEQVVGFIEEELRPQGAMVVIEARHLCVEMRGVKKAGAVTVTSAIRGTFYKKEVREEFLDLLRRSS